MNCLNLAYLVFLVVCINSVCLKIYYEQIHRHDRYILKNLANVNGGISNSSYAYTYNYSNSITNRDNIIQLVEIVSSFRNIDIDSFPFSYHFEIAKESLLLKFGFRMPLLAWHFIHQYTCINNICSRTDEIVKLTNPKVLIEENDISPGSEESILVFLIDSAGYSSDAFRYSNKEVTEAMKHYCLEENL